MSVVSLNVGFATMSWAEHVHLLSFMRQWIALRLDTYRLLSRPASGPWTSRLEA